MKTPFYIIILFLTLATISQAQEQLIPMSVNPTLIHHKPTHNIQAKGNHPKAVKLPFIDDFSYNRLTPTPKLWTNNYVFINKSFGVKPPTIGVATFDAVNDTGKVYSHANQFPFIADSLTSNYIRLDSSFGSFSQAMTPADSIYLSFFFQPQGIGNAPEEWDSLILQFYNPTTSSWNNIWQHQGMSLDSFRLKYGQDFKLVMIPIINTDYFSDHFKFRFLNKATIPNNTIPSWRSGIYDHWNLDYVYLNRQRDLQDTNFMDVTWIESISSLLKNYISMPWNQFLANTASEMNTNTSLKHKNLDYSPSATKNVNRYFSIHELFDDSINNAFPIPDVINMLPGAEIIYTPNYNYIFYSPSTKYADFEITFRLFTNTGTDLIRTNDTMRFYQRFYNYYAYDDGVPESGYGLSNVGARLAYQFTLNQGDSLQSVDFYFNQTLGLSSQQYFYLTVWDDNNGQPGNIIYEQGGLRPEYESDLFKYYNYKLENALYLTGTFYVGWRQTTVDNLNVGFDKNNDHHQKVFYNTSGSWVNSSFAGAPMIRPILGNEKTAFVGIEKSEPTSVNIRIYPNPLKNTELHIDLGAMPQSEKSNAKIQIYSLTGQIVFMENYQEKIQLNKLSKGIYFLRISSEKNGIIATKKLIIQ